MRVPRVGILVAHTARKNLHEAHAVLDEPAGHQTLAAERLADFFVETVERFGRVGFARHVHDARRAALHAVGELVRRDARRQLAVPWKLLHVELVQLGERVEPRALILLAQAGGRLQVHDGIAGRSKERALMRGWNEARAPVVRPAERTTARVGHHDIRRQTRCVRSQSVGHPRADAREPQVDLTGLHFVRALHVIVRAPVDRSQERHPVDVAAQLWKELRHLDAALAVLLEGERARHQWARVSLTHDDVALHLAVDRLARVLRQRRLRIERVHLTPAAAHEERDDGGRAWFEVRRFRRVWIDADRGSRAGIVRGQQIVAIEQIREGEAADAAARSEEEFTPVPEVPTAAV